MLAENGLERAEGRVGQGVALVVAATVRHPVQAGGLDEAVEGPQCGCYR
ncbi:hypothetical protein [Cellulomonas xiejunii]|uniref:Uncharacterized protein n=1 Tax=Cellulomonas xiejunii TaxID=2968083 RepID=A0ABY5KMF3_9CELL|nr:hypothetical protein [Cellulomonas xiejunii]MCC2320707.1 hypothetical protein [Cellulomonas xiejunii]UUI70995.1 hypothetical protein NP048_14515 [Cellulomonas xiejunii]